MPGFALSLFEIARLLMKRFIYRIIEKIALLGHCVFHNSLSGCLLEAQALIGLVFNRMHCA